LETKINIHQINSFLTLADEQHYGRAARKLGVSKQVLSHRIITLETLLKYRLFDRGGQGIHTTLAGKCFYKYASSLISTWDGAKAELQQVATAQTGTLRIGSGPSGNQLIIPGLIRLLRQDGMDFTVSTYSRMPDQLMEMLEQNELECVIATSPVEGQKLPDLNDELLFSTYDRVAHGANHPLSAIKTVSMKDLVGFPWLLYPNYPQYHRKIRAAFEAVKLPPPTEFLYADDPLVTKSLLDIAPYLALWPGSSLISETEEKVLISRDIAEFRQKRSFSLYTHSLRSNNPSLKQAIEAIRLVARQAQQRINKSLEIR
jgi:DNA-binding transcriptional LysR family regulator